MRILPLRLPSIVFTVLALLLCAPAGSLRAAPAPDDAAFAAAVIALDQKSFAEKAAAVEALAALSHPRTTEVLQALSDGLLFRHKTDGRMLIGSRSGDTLYARDAASGADAGTMPAGDTSKIAVNNQVRTLVQEVLGRFRLFSPNTDERLAAAQQVLVAPTLEAAAGLRKALESEKNGSVRRMLEMALAAIDLTSAEPERQRAALGLLAQRTEPQIRSMVAQVAASASNPETKAAALSALNTIDQKLAVLEVVRNLLFGLSLGSILLLAAIGLAITFGVVGVINMAHGEMIMLGSYTTFVVQELFRAYLPPGWFGFYLPLAIPAAFLVAGLIGVIMERLVIRWLYGRALETLLATWGISLMLQQAVRSLFGATNREVANPAWMSGQVELIAGLSLTANRIVIILFGFAVLAGLGAFLRYARMGLNMRAVTQNRAMAANMGIATGWIDALTFGLGSGIAGVAGVALSQVTNVSPNLGQTYIVDSFMVVVFGGVGSLWGTLLGAFSLGIVNKFLEPFSGAMLGKILVLVFIILFIQKRPRGLFALRGRAFEA